MESSTSPIDPNVSTRSADQLHRDQTNDELGGISKNRSTMSGRKVSQEKSKSKSNRHISISFFKSFISGNEAPSSSSSSSPVRPHIPDADQTRYLDPNRILKKEEESPNPQDYKPTHYHWSVNEAALLEHAEDAKDQKTQEKIQSLVLHGYSKAATVSAETSDTLGIQTSPFVHEDNRYHRSTGNIMLDKVQTAYARKLGMHFHEMFLISSPLLKEAFDRELPPPEGVTLSLSIRSEEDFKKVVDALLDLFKTGELPEHRLLIDFSAYLASLPPDMPLKDKLEEVVSECKDILVEKVEEFLAKHVDVELQEIQAADRSEIAAKLLSKLHLVAFSDHDGQALLLLPEFLTSMSGDQTHALLKNQKVIDRAHGEGFRKINDIISNNGYRISPDQAKEAWLKLKDVKSILLDEDLPIVKLATKGGPIPEVAKSFADFMQAPVVSNFKNLSQEHPDVPYLQVLPEATWKALDGLAAYQKNGGIQQTFKDKGIEGLLQLSYFRMMHAMGEAILRRDDQIAFLNQIELIHQEIQSILAIIQPYDDQDFAAAVIERMTKGKEPIVPEVLGSPKVHLKASAMHGFSSILSSVEAERGNNKLTVAILKDCYYESSGIIEHAKTYKPYLLDGDKFNEQGIDGAFAKTPEKPIDLFVCEFHHNISLERQVYKPENVLSQIKQMVEKGLVADRFTVAIDMTMDLENSTELRELLEDKTIQALIQEGKLNLVLLRSAQKFDMLGIDNYYGGVVTSFNHKQYYKFFNERMDHPDDQLKGLSYQGLTHLQKYVGSSLDDYRRAIMENTDKFYQGLPSKAIYHEGNTNPMQISKMEDKRKLIVDIKFPDYPATANAFNANLKYFAETEKLPFGTRPSFGFAVFNFTLIGGKKVRITPGLESPKTLARYQQFFTDVQKAIDEEMSDPNNHGLSREEMDEKLAKRIGHLQVSPP